MNLPTISKAHFTPLNTARSKHAYHLDDPRKHTICGLGIVLCNLLIRLLQILSRGR